MGTYRLWQQEQVRHPQSGCAWQVGGLVGGAVKTPGAIRQLGLKEHVQEMFVVFPQIFMTFAAKKADFPLNFGIIAHRGETAVFILEIKRRDGHALRHFIEIRVIAAIGAGNLHKPFSC
jgi:hypothetical protein